MLHYHGYITYPTSTKVYFQNQADDGFYMSINGTQVINDWSLKGCGANSVGMFSFTGGKSYSIDAWFYEWGGGACLLFTINHLVVLGMLPIIFIYSKCGSNFGQRPSITCYIKQ